MLIKHIQKIRTVEVVISLYPTAITTQCKHFVVDLFTVDTMCFWDLMESR